MAQEYDREWHWHETVLTDFSPCHSVRLKGVSKIIEAAIALLEIERYISITNSDGLSPVSLEPMSRSRYYYMYVAY
jgi:hypothetical protein